MLPQFYEEPGIHTANHYRKVKPTVRILEILELCGSIHVLLKYQRCPVVVLRP